MCELGERRYIMGQKLAELLRKCRNTKGLTLREVEGGTDISNGYLNQLEKNNVKSPSPHKLYILANFYEVPYGDLLTAAGYTIPKKESTKGETGGIAFSLLKDKKITREEAEELVKYLRFLRSEKRK